MKKTLTATLAIVLIITMLLSACGGGASSSTASSAPSSTASVSSTAPSSAPEAQGNPEGISGVNEFPIVTVPTQLVIATPYYPYIIDYDDNEQTKFIEEYTGIDIVWNILPEQGSEEKINLMFASNSGLPDVFSSCEGTFTASMQASLGAQGLIAPLNDLIDKWAYNMKGWQELYPQAMTRLTAPDGNIYSLPSIDRNEPNTYAQRFWINKKFMDALGITKVPETTEEYYDYLVAVKNGDPNGNGKADEIPLIAAPINNGWFEQIDGFLMEPFIYNDAKNNPTNAGEKRRIYMTPEGLIEYAPVQEGWREGLRYLNRLFSEGLMSTEVFTMAKEDARSLVEYEDAELVGSIPCGGPHDFANTAGERRKDYVIVPPLAGPDGTRQAYWEEYAGITIGKWIVTAQSDKKDIAVKLCDYLYTTEMRMWNRYGVEGRDWVKPAEGVKAWDGGQAQYEVIPNTVTWGEPQKVYLAGRVPSWSRFGSHAGVATDDEFFLEKVLWDAHLLYIPYRTEKHVPPLFYSDEEARERTELANTLHQYVELSLAEFVTGARSLDKDWDAYVKECENIGYKKVLEFDQTAFDRQWAETWKATHGK